MSGANVLRMPAAMRALVVDDEAPARRKILRFLQEHDVEIVGEAADATAALSAIRELRPDVVFLDVQMPGTDGFGLLQTVAGDDYVPHVVFVSAYDAYALRAFDVAAVDYLLKPLDRDRFALALDRVRTQLERSQSELHAELREFLNAVNGAAPYAQRLLVESGDRSLFLAVRDIVSIEAQGNRVAISARGGRYELRTTMDSLEARLDPHDFVRVHRSNIVRIDAIAELEPWFHGEYSVKLTDGTAVTWSRRYAAKRPDLLRQG